MNKFVEDNNLDGGDGIQILARKLTLMIPVEEFSQPTEKTEESKKAEGGVGSQFEKEISDFKLLTVIGGGQYGTVYLAQLKADESEFYAIKAMSKKATVKSGMIEMVMLE